MEFDDEQGTPHSAQPESMLEFATTARPPNPRVWLGRRHAEPGVLEPRQRGAIPRNPQHQALSCLRARHQNDRQAVIRRRRLGADTVHFAIFIAAGSLRGAFDTARVDKRATKITPFFLDLRDTVELLRGIPQLELDDILEARVQEPSRPRVGLHLLEHVAHRGAVRRGCSGTGADPEPKLRPTNRGGVVLRVQVQAEVLGIEGGQQREIRLVGERPCPQADSTATSPRRGSPLRTS